MMKKVVALPAPKPRSVLAQRVAWVYAAILVVMAISQLVAFEKFLPSMDNYWLPGNHGTATLVAGVVVFFEIFALPFLLRMTLSPLMRMFSLACSIAVPFMWLVLSLVAFYNFPLDGFLMQGNMLGVHIPIPNVYQLVVASVLGALSLYTAWGLTPKTKHKK